MDRDEWQEANNTDLNWRETKLSEHPKGCNCPKHEYMEEKLKTQELPITYKYCPQHFKAWHETKNDMFKNLKLWEKYILKYMFWSGMIKIIELKYAQSDICMWCRFGSGGRGIKLKPHMP